MNKFAVHLDVVARVGLCTEVCAGSTVDGNAPRCDQFITMPARSDSGRGEETIKAHSPFFTPTVIPSEVEESRGYIKR